MNRNPMKNSEGYPDPTAYGGLRPVIEEENALERRVTQLIKTLKYIIGLAGFELVCRIEIKDKKTGRLFR